MEKVLLSLIDHLAAILASFAMVLSALSAFWARKAAAQSVANSAKADDIETAGMRRDAVIAEKVADVAHATAANLANVTSKISRSVAEKVDASARSVAEKVDASARSVAEKVEEKHKEVFAIIEENTELTKQTKDKICTLEDSKGEISQLRKAMEDHGIQCPPPK